MKARTCSLAALSIVLAIIAIHIPNAKARTYFRSPDSTKLSEPASQPTSQPNVSVRIDNFTFQPEEVDITVGTTVTWQNEDDVPHTATSKDDPQVFDSGALDTDAKFSFTFSKPGKYTYFCKVHPHMTGVVIVK